MWRATNSQLAPAGIQRTKGRLVIRTTARGVLVLNTPCRTRWTPPPKRSAGVGDGQVLNFGHFLSKIGHFSFVFSLFVFFYEWVSHRIGVLWGSYGVTGMLIWGFIVITGSVSSLWGRWGGDKRPAQPSGSSIVSTTLCGCQAEGGRPRQPPSRPPTAPLHVRPTSDL